MSLNVLLERQREVTRPDSGTTVITTSTMDSLDLQKESGTAGKTKRGGKKQQSAPLGLALEHLNESFREMEGGSRIFDQDTAIETVDSRELKNHKHGSKSPQQRRQ